MYKDNVDILLDYIEVVLDNFLKLKTLIDKKILLFIPYLSKGTYNPEYKNLDEFELNDPLFTDSIMQEFDELCDMCRKKMLIIYTRLIDLFFLRRFIDKDYITTAISYTGYYHSSTYIYMLIKYFNFKITHIAESEEKNIDKLHNSAKSDTLYKFQYNITPPSITQCCDISHFPSEF